MAKKPVDKKIVELYNNYGIDVSEMAEDELERIIQAYKLEKRSIDDDIKDSKQYIEKFEDDIL